MLSSSRGIRPLLLISYLHILYSSRGIRPLFLKSYLFYLLVSGQFCLGHFSTDRWTSATTLPLTSLAAARWALWCPGSRAPRLATAAPRLATAPFPVVNTRRRRNTSPAGTEGNHRLSETLVRFL